MTDYEKLATLKTLLSDGGALPTDDKLTAYLVLSGAEILNWQYHLVGGVPEGASFPARYDVTQIYAVVAGFTQAGAEGESAHTENGAHHIFRYSDMVDYIHQNVLSYARVGAVE